MTIKYFKSSHPDVMAECEKIRVDRLARQAEFEEFKNKFGASKAFKYQSVDGIRFCGLRFNPEKPSDLWTKPDKRSGCQYPRACGPKSKKEEHGALKRQWNAALPTGKVDFEPLYSVVGTHTGRLYFTVVSFFVHGGELFFASDETLNDKCQEITGTEFHISEKAFKEVDRYE